MTGSTNSGCVYRQLSKCTTVAVCADSCSSVQQWLCVQTAIQVYNSGCVCKDSYSSVKQWFYVGTQHTQICGHMLLKAKLQNLVTHGKLSLHFPHIMLVLFFTWYSKLKVSSTFCSHLSLKSKQIKKKYYCPRTLKHVNELSGFFQSDYNVSRFLSGFSLNISGV